MKVFVKIGAPDPAGVDKAEVAEMLPYGTVEVTVEAADRDHVTRLYQQLRDGGFQVIPSTGSR